MKKVKFPHPGEMLKYEYLEPLGLSAYKLSKYTGISQTYLSKIINGKASITTDVALKLAKFFGSSAEMWIGFQTTFDLRERSAALSEDIDKIPTVKELGLLPAHYEAS
jgi:addiction module HigA family antidote